MVIDMNVSRLETIEQIREFLNGTAEVAFSNPADESTLRTFVTTVIKRYRYFSLTKGQRGVLFAYMQRLTGYSRQHLSRLVAQYRDTKSLKPMKRTSRTSFVRTYGAEDVALLAETDSLHDTLSGPATKVLFIRAFTRFGDRSRSPTCTTCAPVTSIASCAWSARALDQRRSLLAFARRQPRRDYPAISASIPCIRAIRTV
jgi:hypothetical protein